MLDVCRVTGVEGVDNVSIFLDGAALEFSHIYVSTHTRVYGFCERFTY